MIDLQTLALGALIFIVGFVAGCGYVRLILMTKNVKAGYVIIARTTYRLVDMSDKPRTPSGIS